MEISSRSVPWILAAVTLFFLGVIAAGFIDGSLTVPTKGFHTTLKRASNPAGFYALAGFYAVLAAVTGWLLVAVLRADRGKAARPVRTARATHFPGKVGFEQDGREGRVVVELASGRHAFYREFGGGDCIAIVSVPTAAEWPTLPALAPHPREAFLLALAQEIGARQCPGARYRITDDAILFER